MRGVRKADGVSVACENWVSDRVAIKENGVDVAVLKGSEIRAGDRSVGSKYIVEENETEFRIYEIYPVEAIEEEMLRGSEIYIDPVITIKGTEWRSVCVSPKGDYIVDIFSVLDHGENKWIGVNVYNHEHVLLERGYLRDIRYMEGEIGRIKAEIDNEGYVHIVWAETSTGRWEIWYGYISLENLLRGEEGDFTCRCITEGTDPEYVIYPSFSLEVVDNTIFLGFHSEGQWPLESTSHILWIKYGYILKESVSTAWEMKMCWSPRIAYHNGYLFVNFASNKYNTYTDIFYGVMDLSLGFYINPIRMEGDPDQDFDGAYVFDSEGDTYLLWQHAYSAAGCGLRYTRVENDLNNRTAHIGEVHILTGLYACLHHPEEGYYDATTRAAVFYYSYRPDLLANCSLYTVSIYEDLTARTTPVFGGEEGSEGDYEIEDMEIDSRGKVHLTYFSRENMSTGYYYNYADEWADVSVSLAGLLRVYPLNSLVGISIDVSNMGVRNVMNLYVVLKVLSSSGGVFYQNTTFFFEFPAGYSWSSYLLFNGPGLHGRYTLTLEAYFEGMRDYDIDLTNNYVSERFMVVDENVSMPYINGSFVDRVIYAENISVRDNQVIMIDSRLIIRDNITIGHGSVMVGVRTDILVGGMEEGRDGGLVGDMAIDERASMFGIGGTATITGGLTVRGACTLVNQYLEVRDRLTVCEGGSLYLVNSILSCHELVLENGSTFWHNSNSRVMVESGVHHDYEETEYYLHNYRSIEE